MLSGQPRGLATLFFTETWTLVGSLYAPGDARRHAGFSLFYVGINLGALLGPLVAGYLAQCVSWHIGFGAAAIGMALGLVQYVAGREPLKAQEISARPARLRAQGEGGQGLTIGDLKRLGAVMIFFVFAAVFWGAYEQAGSLAGQAASSRRCPCRRYLEPRRRRASVPPSSWRQFCGRFAG